MTRERGCYGPSKLGGPAHQPWPPPFSIPWRCYARPRRALGWFLGAAGLLAPTGWPFASQPAALFVPAVLDRSWRRLFRKPCSAKARFVDRQWHLGQPELAASGICPRPPRGTAIETARSLSAAIHRGTVRYPLSSTRAAKNSSG